MRFHVLTLFPEFFSSPLAASLLGKAITRGLVEARVRDIRDFAAGKHRVADDAPYGGGSGMVMKVEPVVAALEAVAAEDPGVRRLLLSPRGERLTQAKARALAGASAIALVCGHYEGIDERVRDHVDEELSVGDYVLAGGETAALVVLEAVSRLVPGFVGNERSIDDESFEKSLLEFPQYTRPESFRGARVPAALLSGDHAAIARWRRRESLRLTRDRRPDLLAAASLDDDDRRLLDDLERER
ncbi:MAG: tRNA (guanine37-N1)-methyltransferase [Candidatus Binatota bacterium]|jgi:tRNA (guanine37-N1)-methyltransferase|nr:tRNA (guanine37-N1)-methyltransferase [Candidatus Binatota bacterium]